MTWQTIEDIMQTEEEKIQERRTSHTAPSEKKSIQTTMKPIAETCHIFHSMARHNIK
jgi:hypothetical protein